MRIKESKCIVEIAKHKNRSSFYDAFDEMTTVAHKMIFEVLKTGKGRPAYYETGKLIITMEYIDEES